MNIEFSCTNCGANLKVLQAFAGKSIQCPKCSKKTLVPAVPGPTPKPSTAPVAAVPPPAFRPDPAEAKAPAQDGIYIAFPCGNCAAGLKVLKSFAGKTIQCPKCAKKTLVPGGAPAATPDPVPVTVEKQKSVPATASAPVENPKPTPEAAPAFPKAQLEPTAQPVPVAVLPTVTPLPPVDSLQPRLRDQEEKLIALSGQMRDMELKLDVARLKAERAEQEKHDLASQKATERIRLQEELSVHFQAELEAARKTITRLEERVREATQQRLANASSSGGRTGAQIQKELLENPDEALTETETAVPDAVMAEITQSRFSRFIRTSILIHAVVLGATSVGMIKGYFVKQPPPGAIDGTLTNAVANAAATPGLPVPPAETPAAVAPAALPAQAAMPAGETPAAKPPAKTAEEAKLEALPAPGEKPPADTQVDLGL